MTRGPKVIDLFAGAGGLSEGLIQAGFDIVAANEILECAVKTYKKNHPNTKMLKGDIQDISPEDFLKKMNLNKNEIDLIVGGPPCQGFSMANRQKLIDDPRNKLYKYFVDFVGHIKPKFFILENVRGILHKAHEISKDFEKKGYYVKFEVFNAKDYGVPQNRQRTFFIGIKKGKDNEKYLIKLFNNIHKSKLDNIIPIKEIFWGLRKIEPLPNKNMTKYESEKYGFTEDVILKKEKPNEYILKINKGIMPKKIYNHKTRFNNDRDKEIFRRLPQGGKSDHPSIQDIMPYKNRNHIFKDKYYKLKENEVSKTITSHMKLDCNMYIHPFESRGLTPREAARIQSFPDDYKFEGSFTQWYLQIGNAVPPLLAKIIGTNVLKILKNIK